MAATIRLLGILATLLVSVSSLRAGTVFAGGALVSPNDESAWMGDYAFAVVTSPEDVDVLPQESASAYADFDFIDQAVTLTGTMVTLDEGADWYFVRAGDVFGPRSGDESPYPQFVGWRKWKRAAYAACVVLAMTSTLAGQTVVVNDNIEFVSYDSDPFANHLGIVQQNAAGDDYTDVLFDYDGSNLTPEGVALDQGSDWYVVTPGVPFGFATLASERFTPIVIAFDYFQTVFVGSNEFYLGVSTTSTNGEGITEPYCADEFSCRNVFGWMRLRNVGGQLEIVDNAVAYGSLGIIVGTTDLVPEPSTLTLGALGLVGLLAWRRKSGQRSHV